MKAWTATVVLACGGGLMASAASAATWQAMVRSSWNNTLNSTTLAERLDEIGGTVLCGSLDSGEEWNILWDVRDQELEIRLDGSRVRDFSVTTIDSYRMEFSGELVGGSPTVYGSLELDGDDLIVEWSYLRQDSDTRGYTVVIDRDENMVSWSCACRGAGGGEVPGNCTNQNCRDLEACGTPGTGQVCSDKNASFTACH